MDLKEKQIIYIDGKPYIKCNMVMLSTNNKSDLRFIRGYDRNVLGYNPLMGSIQLHNNKDSTISYQHIYIISDGEIKKDELYCSPMGIVSRYNGIEKLPSNWRKIIATTDESLSLPQLSQQFIEKYIEEYNKGNIITEGLVEVEVDLENYNNWEPPFPYKSLDEQVFYKLKLDSQNTITIRKIKDSWNREELSDKMQELAYIISFKTKFNNTNECAIFVDKWIEENL